MTTRSTRSSRRRTVVALGVVLAILTAFVVRLVDIQVVNADQHVKDAAAKIGESITLKGARGSITDAAGVVLAKSTLLYDAQFSPVNVKKLYDPAAKEKPAVAWPDMAARIGAITGQTADQVMAIVADALAKNPDSQFAYLKRGLSTQQYRDLAELGVSYLSFTSQPSRVYPDGAVGGNLVGYTGVDGDPLGGLELTENTCLSESDGKETFERGKDGVVIPGTRQETPAVDGGTLQLTIDGDLQWYLSQLIAEQTKKQRANWGSITVVEVKTGKIRAAAEYPTVDPNDIDAKGSFLGSRIFQNQFEPASTFKPITASVLIDQGKADPLTTVHAPSRVTFPNGAKVRDDALHAPVDYTLNGVLVDSSNVGISKLSQRVDPNVRYQYLQKYGIGQGSAVDFQAEARGTLYPASKWDNQQLYDTNYGQGVATTVPELMGAYTAIANGGVRVPLQLIQSCTKADGTVVTPKEPAPVRVIKPGTAAQVTKMMENVYMQSPAYSKAVEVPGYRVAMKSGTGQKTDGKGHYKSGVWFTLMIGFAPAENPQYLVAITLDEPKRVKSSAADAEGFQKAVTQVMKTYHVLPSTTKATKLPIFK